MTKILRTSCVVAILVSYLLPAEAQYGSPLGLETTPDARQRHQSDV